MKNKLIISTVVCMVFATCTWADISDGLISYWAFDENSGMTAFDSTGSNDGTLTYGGSGTQTPQWTEGKFGSALDFDGIGAFVDCGSDTSLQPAAVTVSAWIKMPSYGYYGQIAGFATDTGTAESGYSLLADDTYIGGGDSLSMWISGGPDIDGDYIPNTNVPAPPTDWVHVVGTYDGSQTIVYVNGIASIPDTVQSGDIDYTHVTSFYIGVYWTPLSGYTNWFLPFLGQIDDVAVWDRALSENEIGWLYNGGEGNPVPEPATLVLLGIGFGALLRRGKR